MFVLYIYGGRFFREEKKSLRVDSGSERENSFAFTTSV